MVSLQRGGQKLAGSARYSRCYRRPNDTTQALCCIKCFKGTGSIFFMGLTNALMTLVTLALILWVHLPIRDIIYMACVCFSCVGMGFISVNHATLIIIATPQKNLNLACRHFAVCLYFLMHSIHFSSPFILSGFSNSIFLKRTSLMKLSEY